jgi:cytochrome c
MRRLNQILALLFTATLCVACDHGRAQSPSMPRAQVSEAKRLITENCAACHRVPGVARAQGRVGPSLEGISRQHFIAGHFVNSPQNLARWIEHPQDLLPGDAMPDTGLTHEQVVRIVAYLYTVD